MFCNFFTQGQTTPLSKVQEHALDTKSIHQHNFFLLLEVELISLSLLQLGNQSSLFMKSCYTPERKIDWTQRDYIRLFYSQHSLDVDCLTVQYDMPIGRRSSFRTEFHEAQNLMLFVGLLAQNKIKVFGALPAY